MFRDGCGLYRFESSGAHMQRNGIARNFFLLQLFKHARSKMKSGGRCGNGSFMPGVDRLVSFCIRRLGLPLNVGRQRDLSGEVQYFCKRFISGCPRQPDDEAILFAAGDLRHNSNIILQLFFKGQVVGPRRGVAHHALPIHRSCSSKSRCDIRITGIGFKAEYFDFSARGLIKDHAGLYHFGVVGYQKGSGGQVIGDAAKNVLFYGEVFINEQLRIVSVGQGKLCDPAGWQEIVEVVNGKVQHIVNNIQFTVIHR